MTRGMLGNDAGVPELVKIKTEYLNQECLKQECLKQEHRLKAYEVGARTDGYLPKTKTAAGSAAAVLS